IPNNPSIFGSIISKNIKTTPITCPIDNGVCFNRFSQGRLYNYRPFLIFSEVNKLFGLLYSGKLRLILTPLIIRHKKSDTIVKL
ncbi:hypothetical protein, partial [Leuconostoc mesenteroides]|uniref:hypothetical protein n=1 Tax=Leuconostoc mesenteroides TaxID=1245 RepID=UPI00235F5FC2